VWIDVAELRQAFCTIAFYALAFWGLHAIAARWSGAGFYSLFYPVAGLRVALLWGLGAGWAFPLALVELAVDLTSGMVVLHGPDGWIALLAVLRPGFCYGTAVWAVRRATRGARAVALMPPMPFALAGVAGPVLTMLATVPQAVFRGDLTGVSGSQNVTLSSSALLVGDLLGVLLVAPPLLWMASRLEAVRARPLPRPSSTATAEAAVILITGALTSILLTHLGLGPQPAPMLMAVTWIGLRFGRATVWAALVILSALILPYTAGSMTIRERMQFHLGLASVLVAGYIAGSFREAQIRARQDLERRDKLLYQAERLKTLRAMSVAVIHEVSQPLSTLAIEARHLREITVNAPTEVVETAALIDRKAANLSEMVRRLRNYGGRAVDQPSPFSLSALIDSVALLARPELAALGVALQTKITDADMVIIAQEVELSQAILNLVRNAMQACGRGGSVTLSAARGGKMAEIRVINRSVITSETHAGMGVGTLISRAIVEAHGGAMNRSDGDESTTVTIVLPLAVVS
jgi:signal transduction histidine kinase